MLSQVPILLVQSLTDGSLCWFQFEAVTNKAVSLCEICF